MNNKYIQSCTQNVFMLLGAQGKSPTLTKKKKSVVLAWAPDPTTNL